MSSKTVVNGYKPSTDISLNDLSIIPNGKSCSATTVESSEKILKDVTEVEQESKNCFFSLLSFCIMFGTGFMFSYSINTYLSSQITTIEKVFALSSSKSALLLSANDIGFVATVLFAAHFLHRYHIPRILAVCVFTVGVSGIVLALPKLFISDAPIEDQSIMINTSRSFAANLCVYYNGSETAKLNDSTCNKDSKDDTSPRKASESNILLLVVMGIALVVQGIATAPRQALQTIHVDNNTERSKTGFFVGVLTTFTIFGPFLALIVGGLFNKVPTSLRATSLTPTDPRWVGAWWLGFLVFGGCCILTSFPLFLFPRGSKSERKVNVAKENQNQSACQKLKELPTSALRIFKEPVYTLSCFNNIATLFAVMALGSFGPKYLETQFFLPTWKANIILGLQ
ncbi:hypothetical protein CHS0354_021567 [Potamilus streckersoni]|uniref:Solute carrier organic anion transporter family member n=1 Tax=Potamilus streckersoni TaxID=2493646 RepID=A0AAE0W7T7_9BIVA|nr:hypothetical protein CHS0354_021567 [Potamilus streckersoni]